MIRACVSIGALCLTMISGLALAIDYPPPATGSGAHASANLPAGELPLPPGALPPKAHPAASNPTGWAKVDPAVHAQLTGFVSALPDFVMVGDSLCDPQTGVPIGPAGNIATAAACLDVGLLTDDAVNALRALLGPTGKFRGTPVYVHQMEIPQA